MDFFSQIIGLVILGMVGACFGLVIEKFCATTNTNVINK